MDKAGLQIVRVSERRYTGRIPSLDGVEILFQRSSDIPRAVDDGFADLGVTGGDQFQERRRDGGYSFALYGELGFGKSSLVVAVPSGWLDVATLTDLQELALDWRAQGRQLRIATKYERIVRQKLHEFGVNYFRLIHSDGSIEAAPAMDSADLIVDIVETGNTLRENGLRVLSGGRLFESQATLIGNEMALAESDLKRDLTVDILNHIEAYSEGQNNQRVTANFSGGTEERIASLVLEKPELAGLHGPTVSRVASTSASTASKDGESIVFAVQMVVAKRQLSEALRHLHSLSRPDDGIEVKSVTVSSVDYVFGDHSKASADLLSRLDTRKSLT
jgi:ATP phosphoribosyltransferase